MGVFLQRDLDCGAFFPSTFTSLWRAAAGVNPLWRLRLIRMLPSASCVAPPASWLACNSFFFFPQWDASRFKSLHFKHSRTVYHRLVTEDFLSPLRRAVSWWLTDDNCWSGEKRKDMRHRGSDNCITIATRTNSGTDLQVVDFRQRWRARWRGRRPSWWETDPLQNNGN